MYGAITTNAPVVAAGLRDDSKKVVVRTAQVSRHYRTVLAAAVAARAPRSTGAYAASIQVDEKSNSVGTAAPQGHRLEVGFHGTDSAGRTYNQGPQPHFGPAADAVEAPFLVSLEAVVV